MRARRQAFKRPRSARVKAGFAVLGVALIVAWLMQGTAGAATPQYTVIANAKLAGRPIGCVDVTYAASHALIEPVEVHWLFDLGVCTSGRAYEVMLALGATGQLTCADVRWNAAYGNLDYRQVADLLQFTPGCELSRYETMVTLLYGPATTPGQARGILQCVDVTWHAERGLITANQGFWLRDALSAQGIPCSPTGVSCAAFGGTGPVGSAISTLSSLVGKDVRTAAQPCFDRAVIELQPGNSPVPASFPDYRVSYGTPMPTSELPVTVRGGATLVVVMGSWMQPLDGGGYTGPRDIFPTNTLAIQELRQVDNFEGVSQWAIGVDRQRNFLVSTLSNPSRLVIDIQTSP